VELSGMSSWNMQIFNGGTKPVLPFTDKLEGAISVSPFERINGSCKFVVIDFGKNSDVNISGNRQGISLVHQCYQNMFH
jgi:hypothetical protein